jgi:hypothetical protein
MSIDSRLWPKSIDRFWTPGVLGNVEEFGGVNVVKWNENTGSCLDLVVPSWFQYTICLGRKNDLLIARPVIGCRTAMS